MHALLGLCVVAILSGRKGLRGIARYGQDYPEVRGPLGFWEHKPYRLAHWVRMEQEGEGLTWREAARESLRLLLPKTVAQAALWELHALGLWHPPPGEVGGKASLYRLCRRYRF